MHNRIVEVKLTLLQANFVVCFLGSVPVSLSDV
jgi:hypothetical protein